MPRGPVLNVEDLENGGSPKVLATLKAGIDQRDAKKLVRHIRSLNLEHASLNYLKTRLLSLVNGYHIGSTATNIDEPIYRAVPWSEKPTKVNQLGCPPANKVILGRANSPEKPMFYGSAGCHSTIMELSPNQGDRLAISKWRTNTNLHLIAAGYTQDAFKGKAGMNRFEQLPWVSHHTANTLSHRPGNQIVHEFLAREFTKRVPVGKEWQYKISAAICEGILNARSFGLNGAPALELAGILYPSTPNEANADNVALKCHIAEKYLQFVSVQYVEITQKTKGPEYTTLGLDFADGLSDSGEIIWKNTFPSQVIAGTDHTARHGEQGIEIVDNKNVVVGKIPYSQAHLISGNASA